MDALRIVLLCVAAALVCASLRAAHPQMAAAVALAACVAAAALSVEDMGRFAEALGSLEEWSLGGEGEQRPLLKLCGIAIVAELASDVCRDAGEAALARRIELGVRLGVAAFALPMGAELLERIARLLG